MSGTVVDHEEVKNGIVASPPLISPAIILSTDFTITFSFVPPSQIKTLDTVLQRRGLIDISEYVASILYHVFVSLTTRQLVVQYSKWCEVLQATSL